MGHPQSGAATYAVVADLVYAFAEPTEVLLLIEAAQNERQQVLEESLILSSGAPLTRRDDPATGERRVVFTADGEVRIAYRATVAVGETPGPLDGLSQAPIAELPAEALRYLRPSRYCPSDRFESFCRREFDGKRGGELVNAILDWIDGHMTYEAGVSDSATTALDTFVDRAGVCRDFTHLALSLCRASDVPARAVSAHAYGLDPPDMHAVAEVYLDGAWRLLDATRKCPSQALIQVATGLDAADIAFMSVFGEATLIEQSFAVTAAGTWRDR